MALSEFELIARYFASPDFAVPDAEGVLLGVGYHAALLRLPPGEDLAVSVDTLVAGSGGSPGPSRAGGWRRAICFWGLRKRDASRWRTTSRKRSIAKAL